MRKRNKSFFVTVDLTPCIDTAWVNNQWENGNAEHLIETQQQELYEQMDEKTTDYIQQFSIVATKWYGWRFTQIHGLTAEDTANAKVFSQVWQEIEPKIAGLTLVAHNSAFDEGCLKAVFRVYQMDYPDYEFYCTCKTSRKTFGTSLPNHQLHTVAAHCGYHLGHHHHALADAEAYAHIAMKIF